MSGPRLRLIGAALALAPFLAGCVVFKAPPRLKQVDADTVRLSFVVCASGPNDGTCPDGGNSGSDANDDEINVLLIGLRVPTGSRVPAELRPVSADAPGKLRRDRQFSRVLNDEAPTPVGFRWVGYRSPPRTTDREDEARFRIAIGLPRDFAGRRFRVRPTVGFFQPDQDHPADSPIICGDALFTREIGPEGERACIDSPSPDETATHLSVRIDRR